MSLEFILAIINLSIDEPSPTERPRTWVSGAVFILAITRDHTDTTILPPVCTGKVCRG
jgi:hypothetical protein